MNENGIKFSIYNDEWRSYDLPNPTQALFYDYGDDGKIDILVTSE